MINIPIVTNIVTVVKIVAGSIIYNLINKTPKNNPNTTQRRTLKW